MIIEYNNLSCLPMWIERSWFVRNGEPCNAGITQLAECQICNLNVVGANPTTGFIPGW